MIKCKFLYSSRKEKYIKIWLLWVSVKYRVASRRLYSENCWTHLPFFISILLLFILFLFFHSFIPLYSWSPSLVLFPFILLVFILILLILFLFILFLYFIPLYLFFYSSLFLATFPCFIPFYFFPVYFYPLYFLPLYLFIYSFLFLVTIPCFIPLISSLSSFLSFLFLFSSRPFLPSLCLPFLLYSIFFLSPIRY